MSPLHDAPPYWRQIAAEERAAGNERLADDYDRLADVADSWCRLYSGDNACTTSEPEAAA